MKPHSDRESSSSSPFVLYIFTRLETRVAWSARAMTPRRLRRSRRQVFFFLSLSLSPSSSLFFRLDLVDEDVPDETKGTIGER